SLDERRRVFEEREYGLARLRVGRHARRHDDRVRAELPRMSAAHGCSDSTCLRLVAGCQHDPATDDHGAPAQARIVPLLHRGEECVEVGVEDRRAHYRTYVRILYGAAATPRTPLQAPADMMRG